MLRDTSFKLWQDREMTLEDRKGIIRMLETLLFSLKNSMENLRFIKGEVEIISAGGEF